MAGVEHKYCYCRRLAPIKCAWTDDNAGRRFYGCSQAQSPRQCNFFLWLDPPLSGRVTHIIAGLLRKKLKLEEDMENTLQRQRRLCAVVISCSALVNRWGVAVKAEKLKSYSMAAELTSRRERERKLLLMLCLLASIIVYSWL